MKYQITCYLDNISFSELLNRCTSWSETQIKSEKSTFFERENSYHILVVDNSRDRLVYEFTYNLQEYGICI